MTLRRRARCLFIAMLLLLLSISSRLWALRTALEEKAEVPSHIGSGERFGGLNAIESLQKGRLLTKANRCLIRVACVGDSITYGNGSHVRRKERDGEGNYPLELAKILTSSAPHHTSTGSADAAVVRDCSRLFREIDPRGRCSGFEFAVRNFGRSGRTASAAKKKWSYRDSAVFNESLAFHPDLVLVLLGTNDSKPRHWVDAATFEAEYLSLLAAYVDNHRRARVVPPLQPTPLIVLLEPLPVISAAAGSSRVYGIDGNIIQKDILPVIHAMARRKLLPTLIGSDPTPLRIHPRVVPLYEIFDRRLKNYLPTLQHGASGPQSQNKAARTKGGGRRTPWLHDGVHPTVLGHQLLAESVADVLCPSVPSLAS